MRFPIFPLSHKGELQCFQIMRMMLSSCHRSQHQYSLSHQALQSRGPSELAKFQGEANMCKNYSYSAPRTPLLMMSYQMTSLEILYHHSSWLTTTVLKVADYQIQLHSFLWLYHQRFGANPSLTLDPNIYN